MPFPYTVYDPYWSQVVAYFPLISDFSDISNGGATGTSFGSSVWSNAFLTGLSGVNQTLYTGADSTGYARLTVPQGQIPVGVDFTWECFVGKAPVSSAISLSNWAQTLDCSTTWGGSGNFAGAPIAASAVRNNMNTTWIHLAIGRVGATYYTFGNGTYDPIYANAPDGIGRLGTNGAYDFSDLTLGRLGSSTNTTFYSNCYFFGMRLTKGVCRYTKPFSPPNSLYATGAQQPPVRSGIVLSNFTLPLNPFGVQSS